MELMALLYFPSEGSHAMDFYHLYKSIILSLAGFELSNLGSNGKHETAASLRVT
jgi:hypothetical protein